MPRAGRSDSSVTSRAHEPARCSPLAASLVLVARPRLPLLRPLRGAPVRLDDAAATPAVRHNDGVDFVPTRPFYLLGQHFSAIAAAGPIAGPDPGLPAVRLAALRSSGSGSAWSSSARCTTSRRLVASVRHDGRSIAEVVRAHLGPRAWLAMMAFIWLALVYVIVAFTDVTASTFVSGDADLAGLRLPLQPGRRGGAGLGALPAAALVMGLVERFLQAAAVAARP